MQTTTNPSAAFGRVEDDGYKRTVQVRINGEPAGELFSVREPDCSGAWNACASLEYVVTDNCGTGWTLREAKADIRRRLRGLDASEVRGLLSRLAAL